MQDIITIGFSDEDKLIVKTSLFDNYPSCPVRKMIEDFGSIPSERHLLTEKIETKINELEEFESGIGCPLLVVGEEKYNRLKTKFEGKKNIVPCCVLSSRAYNDRVDYNLTELEAIVIYDKILISQAIVPEKTGKIDINEMKHEIMFAPTLWKLEDDDIRHDYIKKYKDVPVIIDSKEDKATSYQVIYESWFHEKSLGNLFSEDAKRILRGVSDMIREKEILDCDPEADVGRPIYYKQYSDYASQLKENTFELKVNPKDIDNLIGDNYEVINKDVIKRIKTLSCVYLYHYSDNHNGRRLDTTSYYTTFCFVRV